ncbi:glutathione S-transferase [Hypericibacter adhaerens]|jgi:glutathione S-transferase|uniref:glutathione transferase n=1 Tax=Hypericibacter adhaerens TaxID=2602016 RepID=A0A5J6N2D2_9PROT|nr:glutathione S-transferase family protein [Hypericibacter adhaerens]QEX23891.1 glutathione S-transferase [Hypericibacter adhaerens]
MAKVILYGPDYSTHVRMIRLCLIEKGVDYESRPVDILRGANRRPDFLKLQPFGRVPVLVHDDFTLYETSAIARYVDEAFKGPKLQPTDKKDAARMNQLISIIEAEGYTPIVTEILAPRAKHAFLGQQPDIERIKKATPEAVRCLKVIDGMIGDGGFVVSKALSLADLYLASIMAYFAHTPEGKAILTRLPKLSAWWQDMAKRPSIVETNPPIS